MGMTEFMQSYIGLNHRRRDPGTTIGMLRPWIGALCHDFPETGVERDAEEPSTNGPLETAGNVESGRKEHGARVR